MAGLGGAGGGERDRGDLQTGEARQVATAATPEQSRRPLQHEGLVTGVQVEKLDRERGRGEGEENKVARRRERERQMSKGGEKKKRERKDRIM